jgi:hypothetical protein
MNKKEFALTGLIVIYAYLAIIFQVNLNNVITLQSTDAKAPFGFNAFAH